MVDPADITPTVAQVASHIRTRTRDRTTRIVGTFTADTSPTDDEVLELIPQSARHVSLELGNPGSSWDGDLEATATDIVALYTALRIEESYYSEGSSPDERGSEQLGRMYREQIAALKSTARDNQIGGRRFHSIQQIPAERDTPDSLELLPSQVANSPETD